MVKRAAHRLPQRIEPTADGRFLAVDDAMGLSVEGSTETEAEELLRALWKPRFDAFDAAELDAYLAQCEALEVEVDGAELERWRAAAEELRHAPPG